jgi:hypothetical protein
VNLPDYHFLSAPLWLVTVLHLLTLTLHFFAMNVLVGGAAITLWSSARNRWGGTQAVDFSRLFPAATAATVTLGVAPLLFLQLVYPSQVYAAAIVSGWFWLLVIAAVIAAYYAFYRASFSGQRSGRANLVMLALAMAGLIYVSLTYSSVFSMAEQPALIRSLYAKNQSGWVWNPMLGSYALRWLHMLLGALSIGGFFVGMMGKDDPRVAATGKAAFAGGMGAAAAAGFAYLLALMPYLEAIMRSLAIWSLAASILLSLAALHFYFRKRYWISGLALFLSLFGMVYLRHTVRALKLRATFDATSWRIAPQWSPFLLFLVCFLAMLAVLAWMFWLFFGSNNKVSQRLS